MGPVKGVIGFLLKGFPVPSELIQRRFRVDAIIGTTWLFQRIGDPCSGSPSNKSPTIGGIDLVPWLFRNSHVAFWLLPLLLESAQENSSGFATSFQSRTSPSMGSYLL